MKRTLHRYGLHPDQHAELRRPGASGPSPVAVLIHGGFWRDAYDLRLMDELADDLVDAGWATWNVEYRRLPEGGWPDTLLDVAAAVDSLAAALEPARVVAIGHSAGGQLALWAAARPTFPRGAPGARPAVTVDAVVSQAGVNDLERAAALRLSNDAAVELLDGTPSAVPERYAAASPAALVPLGVRQLLVHGLQDEIVPSELSESYAARAQAAGDDAGLALIEGEGHFEHLEPGSGCWRAVREWLAREP